MQCAVFRVDFVIPLENEYGNVAPIYAQNYSCQHYYCADNSMHIMVMLNVARCENDNDNDNDIQKFKNR